MSGVRRLIVGDITHGNLRGKALADALARDLTSQERAIGSLKQKIDKPTKKTYGTKK